MRRRAVREPLRPTPTARNSGSKSFALQAEGGDLAERQVESLIYCSGCLTTRCFFQIQSIGKETMIPTALSELRHAMDDDHRPPLIAANLHLCTDALQASKYCHFLPLFDRSSGHSERGRPLRMSNQNQRIRAGVCVSRRLKNLMAYATANCQNDAAVLFTMFERLFFDAETASERRGDRITGVLESAIVSGQLSGVSCRGSGRD